MSKPNAGWYDDPSGDKTKLRYWDGVRWSDYYLDADAASTKNSSAAPASTRPIAPQNGYPVIGRKAESGSAYDASGQLIEERRSPLGFVSLICGLAAMVTNFATAFYILYLIMLVEDPFEFILWVGVLSFVSLVATIAAIATGIVSTVKTRDRKGIAGLVLGIATIMGIPSGFAFLVMFFIYI